jgi:hypothetical protein
MSDPSGLNPYQPPATTETVSHAPAPEDHRTTALADPRFIGNVSLVCISIQLLVKYAMVPGAATFEWLFAVTVVHLLAFVGSIISFLIWLYRVASNVLRLDPHANIKPGWVVGSYFVPFVNWVVPVISMRNIVQVSFFRSNPGALKMVAVVWWLSFMFSTVAQRFARTEPVMMGIWLITITISWICVIALVTRISRVQASFQWVDLPQSRRPMMVPLGGRHPTQVPAGNAGRIKASAVRTIPESDIESGWGSG